MAVQELLQDALASAALTAEGIAGITDRLASIAWAEGHAEGLFTLLETKTVVKRRKQQNFDSATSYMTEGRWAAFLSDRVDLHGRADIFITHVAELDCLNPTEPTCKKWTSSVIAAHFEKPVAMTLDLASKYALYDYIKSAHKQAVRHKATPAVYLLKLPSTPAQLQQSSPAMYERLFPADIQGSQPVQNKLDETLVMAIDNSFQCRGGQRKNTSNAIAPARAQPQQASSIDTDAAGMLQNLLPMLMQGMQAFAQQGAGPYNINVRPGARRAFRALEDDTFASAMPDMRFPAEHQQQQAGGAQAQQLQLADQAPAPIHQLPPRGGAAVSAFSSLGQEVRATAPAALPPSPAAPQVSDAAEENADELDAASGHVKSPGDIMLDAILAKDAQMKVEAAAKRKAEKDAAKAAAVAAKAAASDALIESGDSPKRPLGLPISQQGAKKQKREAAESSSTPERVAPSLSHERTRKQFLGRTGIKGPNGSVKFKYGCVGNEAAIKQEYPSEAAAAAAANAWFKAQRRIYAASIKLAHVE